MNSFEGSQLQQALMTGRDPAIARSNYDRYYFTPPAYPYGYSGYGWGYGGYPYYGGYFNGYYSMGGYWGTYPMYIQVDRSYGGSGEGTIMMEEGEEGGIKGAGIAGRGIIETDRVADGEIGRGKTRVDAHRGRCYSFGYDQRGTGQAHCRSFVA